MWEVEKEVRINVKNIPGCGRQLPLDDFGEELGNQALVVWLELLWLGGIIALAIEIVGVECPDCLKSTLVVGIGKVLVSVLTMPSAAAVSFDNSRSINENVRVEAMIANHMKSIFRQAALVLENVVQVLNPQQSDSAFD